MIGLAWNNIITFIVMHLLKSISGVGTNNPQETDHTKNSNNDNTILILKMAEIGILLEFSTIMVGGRLK